MHSKSLLAFLLITMIILDHVNFVKPGWSWRRRRRRHCPPVPRLAGAGWANYFDGVVNFECPRGKSISKIQSVYSCPHKDRAWTYKCKRNPALKMHCDWFSANEWDGAMSFQCPYNGFIAGVYSRHSNRAEDRLFKFKCCLGRRHRVYICHTSAHVNNHRSFMNFKVPNGYYLRGAISHHSNAQEDRMWRFVYCKIHRR
ncbi:dermatopontin [Nematostella vectensis]|uniref:dermatopontin n=1 Tax=Nematostella vectensis TaxID=45351 RepID=UPI00138FD3BF|nr:dermatopontin [Nematostella vectensis]XP_032231167.1 dermatopontin [Nematostella vectensis]